MTSSSIVSYNYLIRTLGVGQCATVHISLPRDAAHVIATSRCVENQEQADIPRSTLQQLRRILQVTKTCNGTIIGGKTLHQVNHEIKMLKQIASPGHPNILGLIAADDTEVVKTWFTMPLCSEGTLTDILSYLARPQHDINNGFVWHIGIQIAQALIYLHGGVQSDGKVVSNWPAIAHNDLHAGNVFFRPGGQADYHGYPTVVIADFDRAITEDPSKTQAEVVQYQRRDINSFGVLVEMLALRVNDEVFGRWAAAITEISAPERGAVRYDNALRDLQKLTKAGIKRREKLYEPLSDEFKALFVRPTVSDAELEAAISELQS